MGLSKLSKQCEKCKYKDDCNEKRMMACAYINAPPLMDKMASSITPDMAAPVMQKHDYRNIKVAEGMTITIDLDELKERMKNDFYRKIGCQFLNSGA